MTIASEPLQQLSEDLLRIANAAGFMASIQGRSADANPFNAFSEPQLHEAWLSGWRNNPVFSADGRRTSKLDFPHYAA